MGDGLIKWILNNQILYSIRIVSQGTQWLVDECHSLIS